MFTNQTLAQTLPSRAAPPKMLGFATAQGWGVCQSHAPALCFVPIMLCTSIHSPTVGETISPPLRCVLNCVRKSAPSLGANPDVGEGKT